jgi:hypothetical protein
MAVPTIISITPSSGLAIGLTPVKIVGTNFRPASSTPPAAVEGTGVWQQTVSVTFDGLEADSVMVLDATTIWVTVPEYLGNYENIPDAVDVVITNLDDTGTAIPGETVTETGGYTYKRQDITATGALTHTLAEIVNWFRRNVLEETVMTTDKEYADVPADGTIALAELPAIVLVGPVIADDPHRVDQHDHDHESQNETETNVFINEKPRKAKILGFTIHAFGRTKTEITNLTEALDDLISARGRIRILDQPGGSDRLNLQTKLVESWVASDDKENNSHQSSNTLEIYGVKLRIAHGTETGPLVSPDQPVAIKSDDDPLTLQIDNGV